jgi:hypothetical protein
MLTEYEVRRRMDTIRESRVAPLRKVRLLLKLGRKLNAQAESLTQAKAQTARTTDRTSSAGLSRMAVRTQLLHDDVREAAVQALQPERGSKLRPS